MPDNFTLLIDENQGIYIPKYACEQYKFENVLQEDIDACLSGPNHEYYWEAWDDILANATLIGFNGKRYSLYQNGDLWAVDENFDWDTFRD